MSLSTGEPASETGDDSLSAITFDSDSETKAKRKSFHKPPPTSPSYVPGTPVYREKEDMYDEIIELKKSLHVQKSNVDLMRTKLRRLEEENSRKDRQIEQLLDPSRVPDFVRTLAEKRSDTGWVSINSSKTDNLSTEILPSKQPLERCLFSTALIPEEEQIRGRARDFLKPYFTEPEP
eukprot:XP_028342940.1 IQ domain-containing protein E-like isoform X2 [Physeter catodon]